MKSSLFTPMKRGAVVICFLLAASCNEQKPIAERPPDIIPTKPCETLYGSIMGRFRESRNNQAMYEILFTDTIEKRIVLNREAKVYITFISEGAAYANSLGYYVYPGNNTPSNAGGIKKHLLFPHVSDKVLKQGDMLQLGSQPFPAGTVIGFFLVVRGWENGRVNFNKPTFYTDISWNPGGAQQHILFRESECTDIVLAFEDRLKEEDSDLDYNDVIFTIADNDGGFQTVSIDLENVVDF